MKNKMKKVLLLLLCLTFMFSCGEAETWYEKITTGGGDNDQTEETTEEVSEELWVDDFEEQSLETWRRAIEVNLTSAFHLCQALTPELKRSNGGSIINIASIYGQFGPDWRLYEGANMGNPAAYGVSKGGLIQLTRWLATTIAPDVRVNSISPGGIYRGQPEEFVSKYSNRTPY